MTNIPGSVLTIIEGKVMVQPMELVAPALPTKPDFAQPKEAPANERAEIAKTERLA